ncbi:MAG: choice-of-anchor E domain-containing protein [Bacteroidetes bacterium]|nr:choice-of-anchor E domain-containing protein [Bacteroidota bacterium]
MKADRIISWWKIACLAGCLSFISSLLQAQCLSSTQSITYDTLVSGTGNDAHVFTLPKFDPSIGTLTSVNISSVVSVNYGFVLTNVISTPITFTVGVGRKDNIQSAALTTAYNNTITETIGTFTLAPNQTISEAETTVIDRYNNEMNITSNVVDFMGSGTLGFNYAPRTYANNSGASTFNYSATANDTIHFSITYFYCSGIVLSQDITNFSAQKENSETAKLLWTTANEQRARIYEIEKSIDGEKFVTAGNVSSLEENQNDNYIFHYLVSAGEKTKIWFRLKIKDASGMVKYSSVKMVDMKDSALGNIYLYPNPSDQFINIVFNQPDPKNWLVDIFSVNGSLIQKNIFSNVLTAHIDFQHRLAAGTYFVRATDKQTLKTHLLSFVVR